MEDRLRSGQPSLTDDQIAGVKTTIKVKNGYVHLEYQHAQIWKFINCASFIYSMYPRWDTASLFLQIAVTVHTGWHNYEWFICEAGYIKIWKHTSITFEHFLNRWSALNNTKAGCQHLEHSYMGDVLSLWMHNKVILSRNVYSLMSLHLIFHCWIILFWRIMCKWATKSESDSWRVGVELLLWTISCPWIRWLKWE